MTPVDRYPILRTLPSDQQTALAQQADCGHALPESAALALGFHPTLASAGVILLSPAGWTDAQRDRVFPPERRDLLAHVLLESEVGS